MSTNEVQDVFLISKEMATSLYNSIIFGPVHSRRLGLSLGVNLLLPSAKLCSFDCIYCECGWNKDHPNGAFNRKENIFRELKATLCRMDEEGTLPDVITFAGNGEPTLHPEFAEIIDRTIEIRNELSPKSRIAVLTNSTMTYKPEVCRALEKIDQNITKFDSAIFDTYLSINRPKNPVPIKEQIERLKSFNGKCIIQTMFICGGEVNNTTDNEISAWIDAIKEIKPSEVMLYSLDRDTPCSNIVKTPKEMMQAIASKVEALGIMTMVK